MQSRCANFVLGNVKETLETMEVKGKAVVASNRGISRYFAFDRRYPG
jgi:hypothetical protein